MKQADLFDPPTEPAKVWEVWAMRKVEPNSKGVPEMIMPQRLAQFYHRPADSEIADLRTKFYVKPDEEIEIR